MKNYQDTQIIPVLQRTNLICLFLRFVPLGVHITSGIDKIHIYFKYTSSCKNIQQAKNTGIFPNFLFV